MAVIDLTATTVQVRPWPAGGTWNTVTLSGKIALKTTTWGTTLKLGLSTQAVAACNEFINCAQSGEADRRAQKTAHALGLELRDDTAIATSQAAGGVTANVFDRGAQSGPATVQIVTTVGAGPTATYQIEGSADNSTWAPLSTADSATPTVFSTTTFAITSATTTVRLVNPASGSARYIRVTISAVTNVTSTIDVAAT